MKFVHFINAFLCAVIIISSGISYAADAGEVKRITVAGISDKTPLEYSTVTSGPAGAYVEIWKLWSEKTGIELNYVIMPRELAKKAIMKGDIDVIMGYPLSSDEAKRFIFIPDIYRLNIYIYRSKRISPVELLRDLQPYRTGITASDAMRFAEVNYDVSFFIRDAVSELVNSCASGEINVFLAEEACANQFLVRRGEWKNLVQSSDPAFSYGIGAVVNRRNKGLADIITSGFGRITESERHVIEKTWSGGDFKYRIPWGYIATVGVILTVVGAVAVIWWWNYQLQRRIEKATAELKGMKEEAEAANLAKSRFLDNISHELRTPLTLILAPVEDAINGRPMGVDTLEMMRRNSRNLLSLINDLLDLSRIRSGKMKLNVAETDLCSAVKLYCAEMESAAGYNGITLECSIPDEPLPVFIDREKFSGIISNFFSNSLKFTAKGGRIDISLEKDDMGIVLRFGDSGPGIHPDKISTIFDRFSQAEATLSRSHEGTGIGLSIVKEIAELHGGTVSVSSRYFEQHPDNHGTEFFVRIPSGIEHLKERCDIEFIEPGNSGLELPFMRGIIKTGAEHPVIHGNSRFIAEDTCSILIVEDNIDMRFFLEGLLKGSYEIYTASNGVEALEILNRVETIDLILSDMMMPVMDGHELLERIGDDEKFSCIPVLFLTARNDDLVKHKGLGLGAVDYVIKPFNPDELLLRIRNQMQLGVMRNDLMRKNDELYAKLKQRVQPDTRKPAVTDNMKLRIDSVCSFIIENFRNDINRDLVAATIGMNPDLFSRIFNQYTGSTLPDYINSLRTDEAKRLLRETDKTVSRVAIETGFDNLRTFNRAFKKFTGVSPTEFRDKS